MGISNARSTSFLKHNLSRNEAQSTTQAPTSVPSHESGVLNTDLVLDMGLHGMQKPYYDIADLLLKRSPYDPSPNGKVIIVQHDDGLLIVEPNMAKEKALEKVSWQQWLKVNVLIIAKLMQDCVEPREYMSNTVIMSQLAQKYD